MRRANACGSASRTFSKTSRPAAASRFARSSEASWASAGPPRRNARPTAALATGATSLRIVTPAGARTSTVGAGSPKIPVSLWRSGRVPAEFEARSGKLIRTRDLLGLRTDIVGVVSERSNAYRLSFDAGRAVPINSASTFADGIAVRVPDEQGVAMINSGACAIVEVSDDEIATAIRTFHEDTHNLAE